MKADVTVFAVRVDRPWNTAVLNHFHSVNNKHFRPPDHVILMELSALNFRCQGTQQKLQSISAVLAFDHQLKKISTFSVKDILFIRVLGVSILHLLIG